MDSQFYKHPQTGEYYEMQPVKVDPAALRGDLATAQIEFDEVTAKVNTLEKEAEPLEQRIGEINDQLGALYDEQEAAAERLAFAKSRVGKLDAAAPLDLDADDGDEGETDEAMDDDSDDDADTEELAEGDEPDEDPAEPAEADEYEDEEIEIPIKSRARI